MLDTRNFEQAVVKCWSITLTLINDFQGRAQPFAEVCFQLNSHSCFFCSFHSLISFFSPVFFGFQIRVLNVDVEAKGWSSPYLQAALGSTLTMDYFNPRVMMFEPVLEYWTFRAGVLSGGDDRTKPATQLAIQVTTRALVRANACSKQLRAFSYEWKQCQEIYNSFRPVLIVFKIVLLLVWWTVGSECVARVPGHDADCVRPFLWRIRPEIESGVCALHDWKSNGFEILRFLIENNSFFLLMNWIGVDLFVMTTTNAKRGKGGLFTIDFIEDNIL